MVHPQIILNNVVKEHSNYYYYSLIIANTARAGVTLKTYSDQQNILKIMVRFSQTEEMWRKILGMIRKGWS